MNRFRTKKKGKDDASIGGRPSIEADSSGPFRMFGKKKQLDDGAKRQVDLAAALPPSDDFRTSLLMTGLSARFSMLREQDDPNSKLGKASDDSVLSPRRQSRLALEYTSPNTLHDIAEVESLRAPAFGRFDSYQSDDASSTTGSVMGRAKPIEGNNLFGGRQKIYKLNAGSKGGMSGRALYGDDVAQSAFQKWRQAEKDRISFEDGVMDIPDADTYHNYNKRRETNSTTSSAPSAGRDSTAATSIASQPSSLKDGQSAGHLPGPERSVTRTRRLYEQGLTQDLQDHQSSALSRMDTLSRQRVLGSRTPDLTPPVPSPTGTNSGERAASDRRPLLSKASAPNLRSFSASASSYPQMPAEDAAKYVQQDQKPSFGASPPLSPPVSETEEHPLLPIQPNDRGKATAMGMFNRPTQRYDESRYAERQQQLQYGRESPVLQRLPSDQGTPPSADASRSSSFQQSRSKTNAPGPSTFFDDSDDASTDDNRQSGGEAPPQLTVERPNDQDHPAFRKSALPTPLSLTSSRNSMELSARSPTMPTASEDPAAFGASSATGAGAGLSGLVRQHLRNDSGASSVYGPTSQDVIAESSPLRQENNGDVSQCGSEQSDQNDDFARHLANGARRVRERLTTYNESDNERSAPPTPPHIDGGKELAASRSGGLGILRPKSSRGSLFDKNEKERGRTKTLKTTGRKSGHSGASPSPRNPSAGVSRERHGETRPVDGDGVHRDAPAAEKEDSAPHSGLKAFRQARRELQKMKEQELQQRVTQKAPHERPTMQRGGSHDGGPPPALFNRKPYDESRHGSRSRAGSQAASERERSGSEASSTGRGFSRGPSRQRNAPSGYDDQYGQSHGGYSPVVMSDYESRRSPMMSSPNEPSYYVGGFAQPGMSPSHSASALDTPHRWAGASRDMSNPTKSPEMSPRVQQNGAAAPYARSRSGSVLHGAVSTPNLHSSPVAPPLPPFNPRRKNGNGRASDEGPPSRPAPVPYGVPNGFGNAGAYSDEGMGDHYRHHKQAGMLQSPPRNRTRPPIPQANASNTRVPGGMI